MKLVAIPHLVKAVIVKSVVGEATIDFLDEHKKTIAQLKCSFEELIKSPNRTLSVPLSNDMCFVRFHGCKLDWESL